VWLSERDGGGADARRKENFQACAVGKRRRKTGTESLAENESHETEFFQSPIRNRAYLFRIRQPLPYFVIATPNNLTNQDIILFNTNLQCQKLFAKHDPPSYPYA
jgi:hypothetical protein